MTTDTLTDQAEPTAPAAPAWRTYQPPASDRPSGAAKRRQRWQAVQEFNGREARRDRMLASSEPAQRTPRGRQGVARKEAERG